MSESPMGPDLRTYLLPVLREWKIVLATTLLGAIVMMVISMMTPPVYQSNVTFFVKTPVSSEANPYSVAQFGQERVNSYVGLLPSERLANMILDDTKLQLDASDIMGRISGSAELNTVLLTASVNDSDRNRALTIAASLSKQLVVLVNEMEKPAGNEAPAVSLQVVSGPRVDASPISPRKSMNLMVGILGGLLLGLLLAVLRGFLFFGGSARNKRKAAAAAAEVDSADDASSVELDRTGTTIGARSR